MFSKIAGRYDFLNHLLSLNVDRLWRRELIRFAELPAEGRVLDACTGTGDVAIGFARARHDAFVAGIDLSAGMLAVGADKLRRKGLNDRVSLYEGDVLRLPFADGAFHAVTIAFGLRNLPDYAVGIAEMARVLKPGGKLLVLEFCPPSRGLYLKGYSFYLRNILPRVGGLFSGSREAYRYLATSIGDFLSRDQVFDLMRSAGLSDLRAKKMAGGITYVYRGSVGN